MVAAARAAAAASFNTVRRSGWLVITGPNSPNAGELTPLTNDGSHSGSGIVAASISTAVAEALLAPSGKKLKEVQTGLDSENPHVEGGFALPRVPGSSSLRAEAVAPPGVHGGSMAAACAAP